MEDRKNRQTSPWTHLYHLCNWLAYFSQERHVTSSRAKRPPPGLLRCLWHITVLWTLQFRKVQPAKFKFRFGGRCVFCKDSGLPVCSFVITICNYKMRSWYKSQDTPSSLALKLELRRIKWMQVAAVNTFKLIPTADLFTAAPDNE